jgi:hypothetical protein
MAEMRFARFDQNQMSIFPMALDGVEGFENGHVQVRQVGAGTKVQHAIGNFLLFLAGA